MTTLSTKIKPWLLILSSLFAALLLMLVNLPSWAEWIKPQWLVLVVLYWTWIMPQRVNVGIAWLVGFVLDIVYNIPAGTSSLALVLATYFVIRFETKIKLLYFWKKALVIFCLFTWCQLIPWLMQSNVGGYFNFWTLLGQATISTFIWLIVMLLLKHQRKLYFENHY